MQVLRQMIEHVAPFVLLMPTSAIMQRLFSFAVAVAIASIGHRRLLPRSQS
jgi:hypothetical protein